MNTDYDVAIIGSGVGGLCAGALLAHAGYRVVLAEREVRLGGRCSTEEIEGYRLSTGAVALHRGGTFEGVYRKVGAPLELVDMPHQFYRIGSIEGRPYTMPPKGAIAALLDIASTVETHRARLLGRMAREVATARIMHFFGQAVQGKEKADDIPFRDWLSRYTENELVHQTFDAISCNVTSYHTHEITAPEMFALFARMATYPALGVSPYGNEANMKSLAQAIQSRGGSVWTECPVKRILIHNGKARGVIIEKEGRVEEITCGAVISNIGPRNTVNLAGREHFPEEHLRIVENLVRVGMILVHVASDVPLCLENGELGGALLVGKRRLTSVFPLTNFSRALAPPGKHLLYAVGSPPSYRRPIDIEEEFEQTKLDLEEQFPALAHSGRILKFEVVFQDLPCPGSPRVPVSTPIPNLFNVGDGVQKVGSGGTSAAAESAEAVVGQVRKQIKPGRK